MNLYGNTDAALLMGLIFGSCVGYVLGHARGFRIGKREGIVRGKIMARNKVTTRESV